MMIGRYIMQLTSLVKELAQHAYLTGKKFLRHQDGIGWVKITLTNCKQRGGLFGGENEHTENCLYLNRKTI